MPDRRTNPRRPAVSRRATTTLLLLGLAVLLEYGLRRRHWGWRLRAVGSDEDAARRLGVPVTRTVVLGYVLASLLTLLGAVVLMGQYGVGDPSQGQAFTLTADATDPFAVNTRIGSCGRRARNSPISSAASESEVA